jgi:hypothetical protein
MAIEQKVLAERWELSKGRISQLVSEGMPLDSIEAAEKWRAERLGFNGNPQDGYSPDDQGGREASYQGGQPKQPSMETFDSIIERQRLLVQLSRNQYIKAMRELAATMVNRLDKLALDVAESCNPENPAKAVKVLEAWVRRVKAELSQDEQG